MRRARESAHEVRHNESNEADDAAGRDEHTCQKRKKRHVNAALTTRVDAQRDGKIFAEKQHIKRTQLREKIDRECGYDEHGQKETVPLRISKRSHRPKCRRLHAVGIRRHVDDEVRRRRAECADRRAREHELHSRHTPANARKQENSSRRTNRT